MGFEIWNREFERIAVVDTYESIIWTDRYSDAGDFEIYIGMKQELLDIFKSDYYLYSDDSDYLMIIEKLRIETDVENGNHLIVSGRSLESLLCRRIVWNQTTLYGKLQTAVKRLINENIISPSISYRSIPNFVFEDTDDSYIDSCSFDEIQFTGETLFEAIKKMCDKFNVGFKITLNNDQEFVFKLYYGLNRSYSQESLPYVVFSPAFENIINSNYSEDKANHCNVTLVAGEGEGADRKTTTVGEITSTDIDRRELFTDARDLSSNVGQTELTPAQYTAVLENRGNEKLKEAEVLKEFEGQIEPTQMYRYGEHFFMGDICELENEYGLEAQVRVVEYIYSESENGKEEYPTFKIIESNT